jgi:hypothetical protein
MTDTIADGVRAELQLGGVQPDRRAGGVACGLVAASPITYQLHPEVAPQLMHL